MKKNTLQFDNRFSQDLPADKNLENTRRQVNQAAFSFVTPKKFSNPYLIHASEETAQLLGLSPNDLQSDWFVKVFSGQKIAEGSKPYAMVYGGHQFGNWAGQLGDGRAINLGEIVHNDKHWMLQLKGAGPTPFSRRADGLAVLRSSIREHLCSEAMFHLNVPTTRSLSLIGTGEKVLRDIMYDGNAAYEPGAIVCRVAPTFIRFGNFEIFAARQDFETLKKLCDHTISHHFPNIKAEGKEKYIAFFSAVAKRTLQMIIQWHRVGFVHGVMNTDNMSILGLTIDYGPYGWLEDFDPSWTPNTTDRQNRRYRFGNQASVAHWNLYQLANALYPIVGAPKELENVLNDFGQSYALQYPIMMAQKLGFQKLEQGDPDFIKNLESLMTESDVDMTIFYRNLSNVFDALQSEDYDLAFAKIEPAFYQEKVSSLLKEKWIAWFKNYKKRIEKEPLSAVERKAQMDARNPKYVLRNYMAHLAIEAAENGDYSILEELYQMLKKPYEEQEEYEKWFAKRPDWAKDKVGCSMLSCSS